MIPQIAPNTPTLVGAQPVQVSLVAPPPGTVGGRILLACGDTNPTITRGVVYKLEGTDLFRRISDFEIWGGVSSVVIVNESNYDIGTTEWIIGLITPVSQGRIIEVIPQYFG